MTFSAQGTVTSVEARTNGDDAVTITCALDTDQGPQGAILAGTLTLDVKLNEGLQIPERFDKVNLSGWFSYDDGSRSAETAAVPPPPPSGQ